MDSAAIARELVTINIAINSLKISDTYSLDLEASNKFDPGWKNKAIVDKYYSRLYKHVNDSRIVLINLLNTERIPKKTVPKPINTRTVIYKTDRFIWFPVKVLT